MNLQPIDGHTVDLDLLSGLPVLDAGCRGFRFAKYFAERKHRVIAMDPVSEGAPPPGVEFLEQGLADANGDRWVILTDDPEARYLMPMTKEPPGTHLYESCQCWGITELMAVIGVKLWDVVKLNVEGMEADILRRWPGPIAKQISVSFHEHCRPIGDAAIQKIVDYLGQWYTPLRHEFDERHCAGRNAWDSCFTLKELV